MSHSSYTASERRGLIVIAIIVLVLVGFGVAISILGRGHNEAREIPVVVEHPELKDSSSVKVDNGKTLSKKSKNKKTSTNKSKSKKSYRKRSPLDEPV